MDSVVPLPPPGETHTTTTTTTTTTKVKTVRTQSQRRHENSFSTVPKVVPPFYTHSPRLCSWEVGYNFTPKIHRYRGVQGVVHHAWTKADTAPTEPDVVTAPPPLAKAAVAPRRQGCRPQSSRPPWNKAAHVRQPSTRTTSAASRSTSRGSRASARADKKTDEATAQALVAPTRARYARPGPPKHAPEAPTIAGAGPRKPQRPTSVAPKSAWTSRTRAWGARTAATASATGETEKTAANPPAAPPARAHAPGPYRATASAFVPMPPAATSATREEEEKPHHSTPAVRHAPPASRYKPRTSAAYTLPPDYAMQSWALEQGQAPDVVICGSARHRWGDPAKPHTIYLNRHQHQDTRHALRHAYSAEARRYREDRYRKALAHTAELDHFLGDGDSAATAAAAHNYNFAAGADLFEDNAEACAADFYAKEARMRADLIAGVAQLSQVLPASHTTAEGPSTITAVLDDGHACSPILLHTDNGVLPMAASEISGEAGPYDGTAVLVRPCAPRELPATWQELRAAEASRVLPKGREWDRQHAIQLAVGATTQEAIIDLLIDPRYRRPGEFLRQRAKGGCRTAHPFAV